MEGLRLWHAVLLAHLQNEIAPEKCLIRFENRDPDRGGQNVPNARGGGELAPKVVLAKLGLLTPKLRIFYRNSVEKGQISGPSKNKNFHPPSNFRRFDPPYPGLQEKGFEKSETKRSEKQSET